MSAPRRVGLRRLRAAKEFSQEGFTQAVGLNRAYYGGIERRERNVGAVNLYRIAEARGPRLSAFFVEVEKLEQ